VGWTAVSDPPELVTTLTGRPAWQINGHAAVRTFSRDIRLGDSNPMLVSVRHRDAPPTKRSAEEQAESLGWAKVMRKAFTNERVDGLRPLIRQIVDELLDRIARGERPPDLHNEFSAPLVTRVTCALLGIPDSDGQQFRGWWDSVKTGTPEEAWQGQASLLRYVRDLYDRRRREPGGDFVSAILAAQDPDLPYTDRAIKFLTSLVSKGRETPTNALDWAVVLLLRGSREYDTLVREPELVDAAAEEILRLFPVISGKIQGPEGIRRFALSDFEAEAVAIKRGDLVLLNVVGANMDPAVFADPERFDLRRTPNPHLTFGSGPHACPASRLARLELLVALESLLDHFPTLRLAVDPAQLRFKERPTSEGFETLPVTW
jgi:cytochrome P450